MSIQTNEEERAWSATVMFQGEACRMCYSLATDCVTVEVADTGRMVLNIPTTVVLNVETEDEGAERQHLRQVTDTSVKVQFSKNRYNAVQSNSNKQHPGYVFAHSRANTGIPSAYQDSSERPEQSRKRPGEAYEESFPADLGCRRMAHYYLHYIRIHPSGKLRSIHTLHFSAEAEEDIRDLEVLTARLLARVYEQGPKHLLVFVSPVSGKGEAVNIVNQTLLPMMHFSKHTIEIIVTSRAHHCEDYLADPANPLNEHYVVVAVGGDGMVNEAINGIHRRKLASIEKYRSEKAEASGATDNQGKVRSPEVVSLTSEEETSLGDSGSATTPSVREAYLSEEDMLKGWDALLPLVATIPTGSGCGLAKSLDELHPLAASLALIRLRTVHSDLLRFRFSPNPPLIKYHESKLSQGNIRKANTKYQAYCDKNREELRHVTKESQSPLKPFLPNGGGVFEDPISLHIGAPSFVERVAFMSLSYGVPNDIDRGSEKLRWMGNARFTVYGGLCVLRGPARYKGTVRYLPWETTEGKRVEKLKGEDPLPTEEEIPRCTHREDCPFCVKYSGSAPLPMNSPMSTRSSTARRKRSDLASEASLLEEHAVDFNDKSLPWKTLEGDFHMLIICGIKDVAQDAMMAPLAHLRDGAMDIVFCMADSRYGRMDFVAFMNALKDGKHIHQPFTGYVKARAAEITVDGGLVMGDGEMLTLGRVQLTLIRRGVNFVRCEY